MLARGKQEKRITYEEYYSKKKKSFRRRLFSQCVSRKSSTTRIDLRSLDIVETKNSPVYCDECLRGYLSSYFLPPLPAAVAADLVTLPDEAAFFSTSLMTPTATV